MNILLQMKEESVGVAKIADFGISSIEGLKKEHSNRSTLCAPEISRDRSFHSKTNDIYMFGLTLGALFYNPPYNHSILTDIKENMQKSNNFIRLFRNVSYFNLIYNIFYLLFVRMALV